MWFGSPENSGALTWRTTRPNILRRILTGVHSEKAGNFHANSRKYHSVLRRRIMFVRLQFCPYLVLSQSGVAGFSYSQPHRFCFRRFLGGGPRGRGQAPGRRENLSLRLSNNGNRRLSDQPIQNGRTPRCSYRLQRPPDRGQRYRRSSSRNRRHVHQCSLLFGSQRRSHSAKSGPNLRQRHLRSSIQLQFQPRRSENSLSHFRAGAQLHLKCPKEINDPRLPADLPAVCLQRRSSVKCTSRAGRLSHHRSHHFPLRSPR